MSRKLWLVVLVSLFALLLVGVAVAAAQEPALPRSTSAPTTPSEGSGGRSVAAPAYAIPATIITVTTTSDPDDSLSKTCYSTPGVGQTAVPTACTFRRAIIEASSMDPISRPVLISFNIPTTDTGYMTGTGYLDGVWRIELAANLSELEGSQVFIDGDTQRDVGGRTDGPTVVVKLKLGDSLSLGKIAGDDDNVVRGLLLQQGAISLVGDGNIVENNWVGLTIDGQNVYYVNNNPRVANYANIGGTSDDNIIRYNVVASSRGVGIDLDGDDNIVIGNYIGTRANGTLPDVPANRRCHPDAVYYNWFVGDGMHIGGSRNRVGGPTDAERNIIAGMLFASSDPDNLPPDAMEVYGDHHVIQNNYIGKDVNGKEVWVCGMGFDIDGKYNQFLNNEIVNAGSVAIGVYGNSVSLDAITLRANIIKNVPKAFDFGPNVPSAWKNFDPGQITGITETVTGMTVSGTSTKSDGGACDGCIIELFVDDGDDQVEALQPLITTTVDAGGTWTVELTRTLATTEGLRTTSTTASWGQLTSFDKGTTSKLSDLYPSDVTPPPTPPTPTPSPPPLIPTVTPMPTPEPPGTPATVITVTSTSDPDNSGSRTCYSTPGVGQTAFPLTCTLRRAIIEASSIAPISRPVLIKFNIPVTDEGYVDGSGVWRITLDTTAAWNLPAVESGQVVIDGETQGEIGGRTGAPKIIIEGQDLEIGNIEGDDNNVVRGLALQGSGIHLNGDGNIVEDNWVGLTTDGQGVHYVDDNPDQSSHATIQGDDADNNLIQNNRVASAQDACIDIQGDDNVIIGNYVGTNAAGTLPDVPENVKCHPDAMTSDNWFTGDGIFINGARNRVGGPTEADRNIIAGMLYASSLPSATPPKAMDVAGSYNLIQNNYIGKDATGQEVWVCGPGIEIDGEFIRIVDNTVVNAGGPAFSILGSKTSLDAITLQGNVVMTASTVIEFGSSVPPAWTGFNPAKVTDIDGQVVTGTNGDNSLCPYCVVEVFLDDDDETVETLQSLITTTTDADGNWSVTLTRELSDTEGLRTASTVRDFGVIEDFEAGTTSKVSALFTPQQSWLVYLPSVLRNR